MSEETKNDLPEPVAEVVEDIADSIVQDAIEDAVQDKLEELAAALSDAKPVAAEAPKEDPTVITGKSAPKAKVETQKSLAPVGDGAIGSTTVEKPKPAKKAAPKPAQAEETVAIFSTRNVVWSGVGKVSRGYNIVSKSASESWLKRDHIRLATPEEVAKEYNK